MAVLGRGAVSYERGTPVGDTGQAARCGESAHAPWRDRPRALYLLIVLESQLPHKNLVLYYY